MYIIKRNADTPNKTNYQGDLSNNLMTIRIQNSYEMKLETCTSVGGLKLWCMVKQENRVNVWPNIGHALK